jgi:hypothetical protein
MAMRRLSNMAGLILAAIEADGWSCNGRRYRCVPDVYPSVNLGHLKRLKAAGRMREHMV